jgi:hypothetical protein
MNNYKIFFIALIFIFGINFKSIAQDSIQINSEIKSEVAELSKFHEVIYPIWHTAWPEKNIAMLVELLPQVEQLSAELIKAKLPGILRDKQSVWDKGIKELTEIVAEYKSAATPADSMKLLNAAEKLHSQYERLVRTIRPALKEIDLFHSELYMLYHYYLPEWNIEKIRTSAVELEARIELLNKAQLPKRLASKKEEFDSARQNLGSSVKELKEVVKSNDKDLISKKIEEMHAKYQELDHIF